MLFTECVPFCALQALLEPPLRLLRDSELDEKLRKLHRLELGARTVSSWNIIAFKCNCLYEMLASYIQ